MAIYPGATFRPTTFGGKTPRTKGQRGIVHVAVSASPSLAPWNQNTWHFYVAADGQCTQFVDTDFCAWASAAANDDALSIETQGGLGASAQLNAERWTPAAAARIADIMRWAHDTEGIPLDLLPDSQPGRRGWGPHRLGIQHSAGPRPGWWQPGGEVWSSVLGKECPGDAKVAQVPEIIGLARSGQTSEDDVMNSAQQKLLESVFNHDVVILRTVAAIAAKQAATDVVLQQLAAKQGTPIDMAAIEAVVEKGVADAISSIDTTVSIETKAS